MAQGAWRGGMGSVLYRAHGPCLLLHMPVVCYCLWFYPCYTVRRSSELSTTLSESESQLRAARARMDLLEDELQSAQRIASQVGSTAGLYGPGAWWVPAVLHLRPVLCVALCCPCLWFRSVRRAALHVRPRASCRRSWWRCRA